MKQYSMEPGSIDEEALIRQVEKICDSPEFRTKQVLCRFLSYIVSETLAGRGDEIKAFSIGVDVFNRDEDFDPGQDTLVRINAGRLRRMLDLYYSHTGENDHLRIEIPKGGYIPKIISRSVSKEEVEKVSASGRKNLMSLEPSIAVLSLKDLIGIPENSFFVRGFSYELLVELSKFEDLQVFNYLTITDPPEAGAELHTSMMDKGIRFLVAGAVHGDEERVNILINLYDLHEGMQIWSERYSKKILAQSLIEIQESIAQEISGKLGSEYGIILRRLTQDAQRQKPHKLSTYTAILKYFDYLIDTAPEKAVEAFNALNKAVEKDPQSGIALSSLAALHGNVYALDFPNAEQSYRALGELAERAILLDPYNLFVQIALAFKCFLYEEKDRFFHLADRILELNPQSTLRLGSLGFHLSLYGDWERGKRILDSVMQGNLEYPKYFHGATTLYFYRKNNYEEALRESRMYQVPGYFWGHLLRAAVLGHLQRLDEAMTELKLLIQLKPDFVKKARYLISRFVKEDPLVDHILEGLHKAGLHIL